MNFSNICPICLRTDRKLKVITTTLSEYHDELTSFTLPLGDFNYCNDCECLLKKTYNFKQKCANAANILSIWKNTNKKEATSAVQFHKNMSPRCLDLWSPKNCKVFEYIYADNKDLIVREECVSKKLGILKELNRSDKLNRNEETKYEDIESIIKIEEISENKSEDDHITGGLGTPFQNINNGLKDTMNHLQNIPTHNVNNTIQNMGKPGRTKTQDKAIKLPKTKIVTVTKNVLDTPFKNVNNYSEDIISQNMLTHNNNTTPNMESSEKIQTENGTIKLPQKKIMNGTNHESNTRANQTELQVTARKPYIELDIDDIKNHISNINSKCDMNDTDLNVSCINDEDILEDLITTDDENESVTDYYTSLGPKERLIVELRNWGDLQTKDGIVFDKEVIINSLDMFSDRFMERLTSFLHGKPCLQRRAVKLLTMIQERQQFTPYESVFDIEYMLTEKEKLEEFESRKNYECYVKAKFKCEICYQVFKTEKFLENHKKAHNDPEKTFSCHICHIRSNNKTKRHNHNVVFKCKLCPLVTYYRSSMTNHYEQHKGTLYKCDKCEKIFKSKSSYLNHLTRAHPSTDSICAICGNSFVSRQGLNTHMLLKHRDVSQVPAEDGSSYRCDECLFTFSSEAACRTHRRKIHGLREITKKREYRGLRNSFAQTCPEDASQVPAEDGPSYRCDECVFTFFSEAAYRTHRRKIHGLRDITKKREYRGVRNSFALTCPECKTTGKGYGWLLKHYRLEHPSSDIRQNFEHNKRCLCEICGKIFSKPTYLQQHMNFHSGVGIPCSICGKKFMTKARLKKHQEFHYPPSYCCEQCGKKFYSDANLFNHQRIHIGDRRFKCHICGKGFLHRYSVTEHIRGVHNQDRRVKKKKATGKLSTKNSSKFGLKRRRRVTDTSVETTDTSDGVTDAIIVVKDTSNGLTKASNDGTGTDAIEVFEIGAEVILS